MDDSRFTVPLYTIKAAAVHLGMSASTLRDWANKDELLTVLSPETKLSPKLPFIALVEAQLYSAFRDSKMSMQRIRSGMKAVREELGDDMLRAGVLATDGVEILVNFAESSNAPEWVRARDKQIGIPDIINIGLQLITWGDNEYPQSIKLTSYKGTDVVADYRYAFGQPIIEGTRVKVDDVVQLFAAGESIQTISNEYEIEIDVALALIRPYVAKNAA